MIDQNLLNFVRKQVENGVSRDLAVNALLQNGWKITDINNAYMMVEQVFANKQSAPIAPQAQFQQVQQTQQAPEKFVQNKPTQNPNQQGMGLFMKIAVFIIILIFILGIGLFVYLKFFDGSITDILSNIPYVNELVAPKTSDLLQ